MSDSVRPFDRICVPVRLKVSTRMSQDVYGCAAAHGITIAEVFREGVRRLLQDDRETRKSP